MKTLEFKRIRSVLKRLHNLKKMCRKNNLKFFKEKIKPKNRSLNYVYKIQFGNKVVQGIGQDAFTALKKSFNKNT